MRVKATLGAVLAWLVVATVGCRTLKADQTELSATEMRNFDDELGMRPGVGYDTLSADVRGDCVTWDAIQPTGTSQEATFDLKMIESHSQLTRALGISAEAQLKAALSDSSDQTSAKTRFGLGTTFSINQYSVYILVHARIRNETANLVGTRIKPEVKAEVTADEASFNRFRQRCGDAFMTGFATGGEYIGVLEISTDTQESGSQLKQKGAAAADSVKTLGGMDEQLKQMTTNRKVRIWTYQRGGAGEAQVGLVTTTDDMMARMKQLAESVKVGNNPRPLSATMTDYLTLSLDLPRTILAKVETAREVMGELAEFRSRLLDLQGNIDFIVTNPTGFVGVDAAMLKRFDVAKAEIERLTKVLHDASRQCAKDYQACAKPSSLTMPSVTLPQRRTSLAAMTTEKLRVDTMVSYINKDALYDGWFNPPECYLTVQAGRNDGDVGRTVTMRRTATVFGDERCANLSDRLDISVAVLKDAYRSLGTTPESGWVRVNLYEDDPSYDDFIGSADFWFSELRDGAVVRNISNDKVIMELGFDLVQ
jgi:hypothetical protein